jgi:hypothetical protein
MMTGCSRTASLTEGRRQNHECWLKFRGQPGESGDETDRRKIFLQHERRPERQFS